MTALKVLGAAWAITGMLILIVGLLLPVLPRRKSR